MRIAITTWHSGPNAGTFFQLYGLFMYLTSIGHHVEIVNYDHINKDFLHRGWLYYASQPLALIRRKMERRKYSKDMRKSELSFQKELNLRTQRFEEMYRLMPLTEKVVTDEDFDRLNNQFDIFIVGSDQVWNASMLNRRYLLDYVHSDKIKASYCPSMGNGQVMKYQQKVFQRYLKDFNYISTRELKLKEILSKLLPKKIEHLLDPSMLYPREDYLKMAHLPEEFTPNSYLLCYFLPKNALQAEQARQFAKEHNLKLVVMAMDPYSFQVEGAEIYASAGPREFVGLIANAAVVFTSSFHCTIFSIMLHKDLYVFEQKFSSKTADINQRYVEQLETYGITHRYIRYGHQITEKNQTPIDYDKVESIFQQRLKESKAFLNQFC